MDIAINVNLALNLLKKNMIKNIESALGIIQKEKARFLMKYYGISIDKYNSLLIAQNYCCAICSISQKEAGEKGLVVDHNHKTNEIRALLCGKCNMGLGLFKENIDILNKAMAYLSK